MRVSSLSDGRVIDLISRYFVPAWVSRDDYQLDPRGRDEQTELNRIDADRRWRVLEGGTVCVFVLDPDGSVRATLPVQRAYRPENLLPFLQKLVADQHLRPRDPEAVRAVAARTPEVKPKTEGGRLVHVWTRCDQAGTNRGLSHDRVELTAAECRAFLPPTDARPGATWEIPEEIAYRLYRYCYPPGPHWKASDCKVLKGTLRAKLIAVTGDEARIALDGDFELSFPHTGKPTNGRITAHLAGTARGEVRTNTLASLALVSQRADYVWYWQGKPQPIKMRMAMEMGP